MYAMNIMEKSLHCLVIVGLVVLSFKPWLPHGRDLFNLPSTHYSTQSECPSRLAATISCASTAYFTVLQNALSDEFISVLAMAGFISFLLATLVTSTPIRRLLRPPISSH
ncbi:Uncharacterised protein [Legionella spiritensis]|nr:Uncharacterised protein [Legionella spiritensis]